MKRKLLHIAGEVYGCTRDKPRHFQTWWWNKDVDVDVCRKRELFRSSKPSGNEEDRKKYCEAKKDAKRVVYMAMNQKAQKAVEDESPNKVLGRRKMLLGLVVLKMKVGL